VKWKLSIQLKKNLNVNKLRHIIKKLNFIFFLIIILQSSYINFLYASELNKSDEEICELATSKTSSYGYVWVAVDGNYGKYVKEAFLRGLFCNTYSKASNENICSMYINSSDKSNKFETLKWGREIKKRNIKCLQDNTNSYKSEFWNKNINLERKEEKFNITSDNQKPDITIKFKTVKDKVGILRGLVTDNVGIEKVLIDNESIFFDSNGKFEYSTFVPLSGLELLILVIDKSGLETSKKVSFVRKNTTSETIIKFKKLNPLNKNVLRNNNALALIIGIEGYKNTSGDALYADRDAALFKDYASEKLGIPDNKIKILLNDNATEQEILLSVKEWLRRSAKPNKSDIYIFFAGHGLASDDGKNMYLLPHDGSPRLLEKTAILRNELFSDIQKANPRSVTVFLDTCYSGTTRGTDMLIASRPIAIRALEQSIPNNFTVFSAAAGDQTSKPLEEAKHGMFSYFLMKGMEGDADANNDNKITARELHAYVEQNVVQQSSGSQTPELQGDADRVLVQFN
jgi:hypothetical protein